MAKNMEEEIAAYTAHLEKEEKSKTTIRQYVRDVRCFMKFSEQRLLNKEIVILYKERLQENLKPASVNSKIAALNSFFQFIAREDLKVKALKIQRKVYCKFEKDLSREDYLQLLAAAQMQKDPKISLLIQTICGTGIRVSELEYITVEAVKAGEAFISRKGKNRTILLGKRLQEVLKCYILRQHLQSGPVFITRNGKPLDRSNIWKMMKGLCITANIEKEKVFPHNLRHLFAKVFYEQNRDIAKLADLLGHSNINTTRIYIVSTGNEHRKCLDALGLVI